MGFLENIIGNNKNLSRKELILLSASALMAHYCRPLLAQEGRAAVKKPNILFIMADDLGYECLECNGGLSYKTPNLNSLAAEGMRFTHAYSTPLCTPTRVQLMTGRYNFRNYNRFKFMKAKEMTFANIIQQSDYRTGIFGKWQLGNGKKGPFMAGFDEYCLFDIFSNRPKGRGSRYYRPKYYVNGSLQYSDRDDYGPDIYSDHLCDFMEQNKDRPFLAYFPMVLPHTPFRVPPGFGTGKRKNGRKNRALGSPRDFKYMVEYMDKIVGKVMGKLTELGLDENTLVIFTGDNGCHPSVVTRTVGGKIRGGKGRTTDAGTHVPMIARWKGTVKKGSVCGDLVDFTDFFPTFLELTGTSRPWLYTIDGKSFLPQLKGEKGNPRKWIFLHYDPGWRHWTRTRYVRNHRYKLYGRRGFYDLKKDPLEMRPIKNCNGDPELRRLRRQFRKVLKKMKKRRHFI